MLLLLFQLRSYLEIFNLLISRCFGQAKFAIAYLAPQGPTLRLIFGVQRIKCKSLKRRGPSLLSLIAPALKAYKERSAL